MANFCSRRKTLRGEPSRRKRPHGLPDRRKSFGFSAGRPLRLGCSLFGINGEWGVVAQLYSRILGTCTALHFSMLCAQLSFPTNVIAQLRFPTYVTVSP